MSEGFALPPSDDGDDPLLAALRRQLGPDFGQAPPPAAWAGIRRRLAPLPWWRRPRRLAPLLALLVGLVLLGLRVAHAPRPGSQLAGGPPAPGSAAPQAVGNRPAHQAAAVRLVTPRPAHRATPMLAPVAAPAGSPAAYPAAATGRQHQPPPPSNFSLHPQGGRLLVAHQPAGLAPHAASRFPAYSQPAAPGCTRPALAAGGWPSHRAGGQPLAGRVPATTPGPDAVAAAHLTSTPRSRARHRAAGRAAAAEPGQLAKQPAARQTGRHLAGHPPIGSVPGTTPGVLASRWHRPARTERTTTAEPLPGTTYAPAPDPRQYQAAMPARRPETVENSATAAPAGAGLASLTGPPGACDSLRQRPAGLVLAGGAVPAPLSPRPDSSFRLPARRRWLVQVLAGPTLSYRTLPAASSGGRAYAASSPISAPSNPGSTGYNPVALAYSEQPARGLGAQVQARRVLSGRWALAVGLGYQEYATRLQYATRPGSLADSQQVTLRDTYRLLTVPVQFSYAPGPPRRHWSLGLLAGAEPGWYRGGRTAEGVTGGTQQTFASAAASPYHAWNVALSLGLDLRYRLGGPAARWQLVLQPTGRYVATPFVKSTASGYVSRQPYSLGVLAGLAWDWR